MMVTFIDLFAGIGGMRQGMERNGLQCVLSADWNLHAQEMYERNFNEKPFGDVSKLGIEEVPNHDILVAGFPCQAFSISGKKLGFSDTRGTAFFDVLQIAKEKKPSVIFLENVKHLIHHDKGRTLQVIISCLEELGYQVSWKLLNASDFGVPQNRERIIIIASKEKVFDFSKVTHQPKVQLKDFLETDGEFEYLEENEYTLLSKEQMKTQKSGLLFAGYRNKEIRKNGVREGTMYLSRTHKQINRIYSSDGVHPTLSSSEKSGRYFILHEGKVRRLTIRECYKIMGFPNDFKLVEPISNCYERIGNSVCVPMIEAVAKEVKHQFFT